MSDNGNDTFRITVTEAVHGPNMFKNVVLYGFGPLNAEGEDKARRLFWLAALFPTCPAGVLLDVVNGVRSWVDQGETLVIGAAGESREVLAARLVALVEASA